MKDQETQQRFILMRSQGVPLARIAETLDVSPNTMVLWSRKFQFEIQNLRAMELEALREQLRSSRDNQARALAEELRRVEQEIKKRDLTQVTTPRLYSLADSLRRQLDALLGQPQFATPVEEIPADKPQPQVAEARNP